jgi:uncharacterized membrane protein YedE/YeeE
MHWDPTSALQALIGGVVIGLAAGLLLASIGRIAGISGILFGLLAPARGDVLWRALFVGGLLAGGAAAYYVSPASFDGSGAPALAWTALAGALVGIGTRLGNGCTSGHGVCGIGRLSPRSIAATLTFMATGMWTVALVRNLGGAQ